MNKQKKLFLLLAVLFLGTMFYISYDISRKTTFPGSEPQLKERLFEKEEPKQDSVVMDTLR